MDEFEKVLSKELGVAYIGPADWSHFFQLEFNSDYPNWFDLKKLLKQSCPFNPGKIIKETHMLMCFPENPAEPLNLHWWNEQVRITGSDCWKKSDAIGILTPSPGWHLIYKGVVPGLNNKTLQEQIDLLPKPYRIAKGCEVVALHAFCCHLNGDCRCNEALSSCKMIGRTAESGLGLQLCMGDCKKNEIPVFSCFLDQRKSEQMSVFAIRPVS